MKSNCRIDIQYIDPETYSSIVNHPLRREILRQLYVLTRDGPLSKQELADKLQVGYHQLVYQLSNHLREFWTVLEEKKVRGTRMELIGPAYPYDIFIALGRDNAIYVVDPIANIFGPLRKVGTRCDSCSPNEAKKCVEFAINRACCASKPKDKEIDLLEANGRRAPFRTVDHAIICALRGIPEGSTCSLEIPCDNCAFMRRVIQIH